MLKATMHLFTLKFSTLTTHIRSH